MRASAILAAALLVLSACKKDDTEKPAAPKTAAPVTAGTVSADGVRRVPVTAGAEGYVPAEITARPNEKLILEVTRTVEGACMAQISVAGGPAVELPMNKPVDIPVTVPASGSIGFACGMDMFRGTIVVPAT
jgi:plastocyanin domain-containing protein